MVEDLWVPPMEGVVEGLDLAYVVSATGDDGPGRPTQRMDHPTPRTPSDERHSPQPIPGWLQVFEMEVSRSELERSGT